MSKLEETVNSEFAEVTDSLAIASKALEDMEANCQLVFSLVSDQAMAVKQMRQLLENDVFLVIQQFRQRLEYLQTVISDRDEKIKELECLQNPYLSNGEAICNSVEQGIV